jgi:hypothetical protein
MEVDMFLKISCFLLFNFVFVSINFADTSLPGGYVSGTWTAAGSPYQILDDITIHADSSLTIEPGVEVVFQGLYTFQVNGALVAVGTEMDSISFSAADTSVGWRGIRLDAAADPSWISYATICYGRNTDGGGIYCASPDAVIAHCAITDNKATNNGGGICINTGLHGPGLTNPPSVFNKCVISRNSARFGGGVFYMADSMIISDCVISHNSATHSTGEAKGGGIYFDGGFVTSINIYNCVVQNNFCESDSTEYTNAAYGLGGGLYIEGQNRGGVFISNCQILSNWSRRSGGGVFVYLGGAVITDCTLRGNFTKPCAIYFDQYLVGGGAISFSNLSTNSIISHCEISENYNLGYAPTGGGAIRAFYNVNASLTLENCTISRNSSLQGWGAIHFNNTLILKNSIIAFNQSGNQKGSILASSADFSFCDFFSNDGDPDRVLTSVNVNGDSCDAYANISLDPLFTDTTNSNYLITWANWPVSDSTRSPAIDAGDPESPSDFDETSADMGTYYFNQKRPLIEASDELLDFGEVFIGTQSDTSLLLYNHGFDTLDIYNIISPGDVFSTNFNSANTIILPEDSLEIIISFSPADEGFILDTLFIESNDKPSQVFLQGTGKISTGIGEDLSAIPKEYALDHAYPNPFNPSTHIKFALPKPGHVLIEVYNILGQKIDMLVNKEMTAGYHEIVFDAKNHPSAMYFYQIQAGEYQDVKKMLLIK